MMFPGRQNDAESTIMPAVRTWVRQCLDDVPCNSPEDHSIYLWLNCPAVGIMPTLKYDFFLTFLSNILTEFSKNSVCLIIYPNRACQMDRRTGSMLIVVVCCK